jgi:hypothetical protein
MKILRASEQPEGFEHGDPREVRNQQAPSRAMARECGQAADFLVRKARWTQEDRDGVVLLLRRAERMLLEGR